VTTTRAIPQRSRHLSKGLVRTGETVALAVLCMALLLYYSLLVPFMVQRLNMGDFGNFYYSTQSFVDGQNLYGRSLATDLPAGETVSRQNLNPPHFHLLMIPFAVLNPAPALSLWVIASLVALCVSLRAIARELQFEWTNRSLTCTAAAAMGCSATVATAVTGQLTFLLLLPVTLAWIAARHNNWNRAAAYLACAQASSPSWEYFSSI
jgi:glycosyl transferase family 87